MAEASQESRELPAGESSSEKPSDQPVRLDSVGELNEPTVPSQQEAALGPHLEVLPSEPVEVREQNIKGLLLDDASELKQVLSGIMGAVQLNNTKLQELSALFLQPSPYLASLPLMFYLCCLLFTFSHLKLEWMLVGRQ
jgi:hypothetical protein